MGTPSRSRCAPATPAGGAPAAPSACRRATRPIGPGSRARSHEYARTSTEPDRRAPSVSVYGVRRHRWLPLPEGIEHDEVWSELQSLYGAGDVACCESMAGRAGDARLG